MPKHEAILEAVNKDASLCDSELDVYRFDVLKRTLFKKYIGDSSLSKKLEDEALDDFIQRNQLMAASRDYSVNTYSELLTRVKRRLEDLFFSGPDQTCLLSLNEMALQGLPGPGASRGVRDTDFIGKMFLSDLTTTDLRLYQHYVGSLSPRWSEAEKIRSESWTVKELIGSNITTVPKDVTKNRTIATEPSLNMFYQKGGQKILEAMLRRFYKLDVSKQPDLNKILACAGSIDGSNATIDLKNASDSWHEDLVRYLLPQQVFDTLNIVRSKWATVRGENIRLSMFSTMGNGFTFPLMTLLFVAILDEFLRERGDAYTPYRDGVFGDDIILPSRYSSAFIHLLEEIGFIVNTDKSFTTGFFRESCGGDFFHGNCVRGVYIRSLQTNEDIYSAFNRLLYWGVRNGVSVTNTLLCLKGLADFRPVPLDEGETAGFKIPSLFLKSPKYDENGATIYRCSVAIKRVRRVSENTLNAQGALTGFLGGYVSGHLINLRRNSFDARDQYKVIKCKTPSWDFVPDARASLGGLIFAWRALLSTTPS